MSEARYYQRAAVDAVYDYWGGENGGNPLIDLATGTGKSFVIALLLRELLEAFPDMRVLVLVHVKELVEQDAKELLQLWPGAPIGINSAGLGRRDTRSQILFASIQSVYRLDGHALGPRDLVLIDEVHMVPKSGNGMFRTLIDKLRQRVWDMRIVGLTATPYRMDSGRLDRGDDKLFDRIVYSYGIADGVKDGFLAPLVSKATLTGIDVSGVAKKGGEFVESDLQRAVDRDDITESAVREIVELGAERRSWLVFCTGISHAENVRNAIRRHGVRCEMITGETPACDRKRIIDDFRSGVIRCLTNANVLTTGFNAPRVDLLAMLRPTLSSGLYVQICGRGTRLAEGKTDSLVLDFAGNVRRHGPVDAIVMRDPGRRNKIEDDEDDIGVAVKVDDVRAKACPACRTLTYFHAEQCANPQCDHVWPKEKPKHDPLADAERPIMSGQTRVGIPWLDVNDVQFARHNKVGAPSSMRVTYTTGLTFYSEWICFEHSGYARTKAEGWWRAMYGKQPAPTSIEEALSRARSGEIALPVGIFVQQDGNFWRVQARRFDPTEIERAQAFVAKPIVAQERASWWSVLAVDQDADEEEIKAAYRRLAREHHPDVGGDVAVMANLNRAYEEGLNWVEMEGVPF